MAGFMSVVHQRGVFMQFKQLALAASLLATGLAAQAQTEIQW